VALTAALGTSLTGTLMVLDEPTAGLHPRDAARLIGSWPDGIAALGNVALVIEHDLDVIAAADRVIELGPDAGEGGGHIVFDGARRVARDASTPPPTRCGRGALAHRARPRGAVLSLRGARGHNLRGVDLDIPLGVLTVITGVSGSGKSSLVGETLHPAVTRALAARALPVRAGGAAAPRRARRRRGAPRRRVRRPGPAGAHHPRQPGDVPQGLRAHPHALRDGAREQGARVHVADLLVQRRGRALPHLRGGGLRDRGDAVPRRRELQVPRLPRADASRRGARGARARRSIADVLEMSADAMADHFHDDAASSRPWGRCARGPRVPPRGAVALHPLRRRGATAQARRGPGRGAPRQPGDPRRAHDGPAPPRRGAGVRHPRCARRAGRATVRRGGARPLRRSARRLGDRPRPRGRPRRRRDCRRGHARDRRRVIALALCALPPRRPRPRRALRRHPRADRPPSRPSPYPIDHLDGAREHNLQVPHLEIPGSGWWR
jgi:hypothetical protein